MVAQESKASRPSGSLEKGVGRSRRSPPLSSGADHEGEGGVGLELCPCGWCLLWAEPLGASTQQCLQSPLALLVGFIDLVFSKLPQVVQTGPGEPRGAPKGASDFAGPHGTDSSSKGSIPNLPPVVPGGPGAPRDHHADAWLWPIAKSWACETFHLVHFSNPVAGSSGEGEQHSIGESPASAGPASTRSWAHWAFAEFSAQTLILPSGRLKTREGKEAPGP